MEACLFWLDHLETDETAVLLKERVRDRSEVGLQLTARARYRMEPTG
jgi:hypothetical protein